MTRATYGPHITWVKKEKYVHYEGLANLDKIIVSRGFIFVGAPFPILGASAGWTRARIRNSREKKHEKGSHAWYLLTQFHICRAQLVVPLHTKLENRKDNIYFIELKT